MYLSFVLILFGWALLMGSLTPFFIIPLFIILIDRKVIIIEERMLEARFGAAWEEYSTQTKRWV